MSDLTPMSEIMQHFIEDLQSGKLAEDCIRDEKTYRKGYHHGYNQAIEDIFRSLDEGMSKKDAYALVALQCNLIGIWRTENNDQYIVPPHFNKLSLLETVEHRRAIREQSEEE